MPETQIHRLALQKASLAALPAEERCLLFLFGHMSDELQTLTRLLLFSLHKPLPNEIAERVAGGRANIVLRMLCGKLWEAHELVRKRIQGSALGRRLAEALTGDAADCYKRIRQQAGGVAGNMLSTLRNNHAFHFPSDDVLDTAFDSLDASEPLEFFISENGDANFYHAAEVVIEMASFGVVPGQTFEARIGTLADIVVDATRDLIEFAGHICGQILDGAHLLDALPDAQIVPAEYLDTTAIPPITVRCPDKRADEQHGA